MADVTGSSNLYDSYLLDSLKGGTFLPESDALKIGLAGASYTPLSSHSILTDITDEMVGSGYSRITLTNVSLAISDGYLMLNFDAVQFSANGGNLAPKYWFLFDDTPGTSPLIAWGQINAAETDAIALVDGFNLDVVPNSLGLFRVAVPVASA